MTRKPKTQEQLDTLLLEAYRRECGAKIYDELRHAFNIFNLMDVKSMIEVGNENGGGISAYLNLWDDVHFFGVDADLYGLKTSRADREHRWRSWCSPKQTLDIIWGDSHAPSTLQNLKTKMAEYGLDTVDLLSIDGDHSEAGTEQDFYDYGALVSPGGCIVVEDIHPYTYRDGPKKGEYRPDVMVWKFWDRLKPPIISSLGGDRKPHPRPNWNVFSISHDAGNQNAFGYGFVFK